jgi:hypothetical protein
VINYARLRQSCIIWISKWGSTKIPFPRINWCRGDRLHKLLTSSTSSRSPLRRITASSYSTFKAQQQQPKCGHDSQYEEYCSYAPSDHPIPLACSRKIHSLLDCALSSLSSPPQADDQESDGLPQRRNNGLNKRYGSLENSHWSSGLVHFL